MRLSRKQRKIIFQRKSMVNKKISFVDTNIFLRLIADDSSEQHDIAEKIFLDASEGKMRLATSSLVIFEIYWVLTSFYKKEKKETIEILIDIFRMSFIQFENKKIILRAIYYFKNHNLELEDCYNLFHALANDFNRIITFDKKLKKAFTSPL